MSGYKGRGEPSGTPAGQSARFKHTLSYGHSLTASLDSATVGPTSATATFRSQFFEYNGYDPDTPYGKSDYTAGAYYEYMAQPPAIVTNPDNTPASQDEFLYFPIQIDYPGGVTHYRVTPTFKFNVQNRAFFQSISRGNYNGMYYRYGGGTATSGTNSQTTTNIVLDP